MTHSGKSVKDAGRRAFFPVGWIVAAYGAAVVLLSIILPDRLLTPQFHDDSFFYLKTARNMARGLGSTFDGINPTNGYHPLWMVALAVLAKLGPAGDFVWLRILPVLHAAMNGGAFLLCDQVLQRLRVSRGWRWLAVAALVFALGFSDFGMESSLLLLCTWSLVRAFIATTAYPAALRGRSAMLVVLSACVVWSRMDALVLPVALAGVRVFHDWRGGRAWDAVARRAGLLIVPALGAALMFSLYNQAVYGHAATVSSALKAHFPGTYLRNGFAAGTSGANARLLVCVALPLAAIPVLLSRLARSSRRGEVAGAGESAEWAGAVLSLLALAGGTVLHMAGIILCASIGPGSWYFTVGLSLSIAVAAMFGSEAGRSFPRLRRPLWMAVSLALLVAAVLLARRYAAVERGIPPPMRVAEWLRRQTSPGDVIYQVDATGIVGYFSHRSVICGDGLSNGWRYQDALRNGWMPRYLREAGVSYFVSHHPPRDGRVEFRVPRWNGRSVLVAVAGADHAVFRAGPYRVFPAREVALKGVAAADGSGGDDP